jgi:hypothetical protein
MAELFDVPTILMIAAVVAGFVWVILTASGIQHRGRRRQHEIERKLSAMEGEALVLRNEVKRMRDEIGSKTDYDYLNQRVDGLIKLIKSAKTA